MSRPKISLSLMATNAEDLALMLAVLRQDDASEVKALRAKVAILEKHAESLAGQLETATACGHPNQISVAGDLVCARCKKVLEWLSDPVKDLPAWVELHPEEDPRDHWR